jgi:hypothetical protein
LLINTYDELDNDLSSSVNGPHGFSAFSALWRIASLPFGATANPGTVGVANTIKPRKHLNYMQS